jgi:hypothetical protein
MKRASTMQEYQELINQALFELQDLRASVEFDEEFMGEVLEFVEPLETSIRKLNQDISDGSYCFSKQNLPFMPIVYQTPGSLLPFKQLLIQINDTHIHGLE